MHAKHVAYFLRELFIHKHVAYFLRLKFPYIGFVIKMFLRPGVVWPNVSKRSPGCGVEKKGL